MPRKPGSKNIAPVTSFSFVDETVPVITRDKAANPFAEVVAAMADAFRATGSQAAKGFDVPNENVEQSLRLLSAAGRDNGVTIRKTQKDAAKPGVTHVTFWPVPLQHRARKA